MGEKKKVVILTTFYEAESGYSLINVTETQIRMLLDHQYQPVVLVQENFESPKADSLWHEGYIDLRPVVPKADDKNFDRKFYKVLEENLSDADVCIAHDIIFQDHYRKHDRVLREYAEERNGTDPSLLWLHWIHSRPNHKYKTPRGWIVYPNKSDLDNVKKCYGTYKVVANRASHAIDPLTIHPYDSLTKRLIQKSGLLDGDVRAIYPRGADPGKQTEKVIRLLAGVKKLGLRPKLLVIDWQSQGDRFQRYMDKMRDLAGSLDLDSDVTFSSRLDDACSQGVPRNVVMELFDFTNVYIHASESETYCLVAHEAFLKGNLVCLNFDWEPMKELFGNNAIYFDFGSVTNKREYWKHLPDGKKIKDKQAFWDDEARRLVGELRKNNRAVWAKSIAQREWTPQALWYSFEKLLHMEV